MQSIENEGPISWLLIKFSYTDDYQRSFRTLDEANTVSRNGIIKFKVHTRNERQ